MNYIIRKKERKDCFAIARVITVSWNETYKKIVPDWFLQKLINNEKERGQKAFDTFDANNNTEYVLEIDGDVVGFVKFERSNDMEYPNCGEIKVLYIISKYKDYGFGKQLVCVAKKELKNMGYNSMIISCLKGNPSNQFYKHIGGIYVKDRVFELLNIPENVYYFDI